MRKTIFLFATFAFVLSLGSFGQKFNFQGIVRDLENNTTLQGVVVKLEQLDGAKHYSAISNAKGSFSFDVGAGNYLLVLTILGYESFESDLLIESDLKLEFLIEQQPISLGEIVVSSFRVNRKVKELPTPMAIVSSYDYQRQSALSLSSVLTSEPGISMGSDGVWATNINIRGLNENRLVTLIDGNRVETATDLTASLSMIDVNDVERVEVIKGAQSVLYGTGAMGGIVNIITKDGHFAENRYFSGSAITGFSSANDQYNGHLSLNAGDERWYLRLSGTYADANEIRTPDGKLHNSQFTSNNISARIGVRPKENHELKLQYHRYMAHDVGIPGGEPFPGPATATFNNIGRQLFSASYEAKSITPTLSSLKLNYYNQYILRDVSLEPNVVNTIPLASGYQRVTPTLFTPKGEHFTQGAMLQGTWNLAPNHIFIAGIDTWERELITQREKNIRLEIFDENDELTTTNNIIRGETPIPRSTFRSMGVFLQNEVKLLNERLTLILGGRFDGVNVSNEQGYDIDYLIINGNRNDTPPNQRITFEESNQNNYSWSANTGLLFSIINNVDASLNLARSFRAPSLEELFKYIDLTNMVRLGDPTLKPESGYSVDFGVRVWKPNLTLQMGAFTNWIDNMIVETPGEFIYTINTGPQEGLVDTLPALINANVSKALLYGADLGFQYSISNGIVLLGSAAYVIGKDTESNTNLPQIPPFNGRAGIRYSQPRLGSAQLTLVGASKQDRIADGEVETSGYHKWDLALNTISYYIGASSIQFFAGIDNIADTRYTNHLATNRGAISIEPGRNIYLRLNVQF